MHRAVPVRQVQERAVLPWWLKLYIYGLHGFFIEVLFTAGWEYAVNTNWKLPGCSSVWSLAIYGVSGLVMEYLHTRMQDRTPVLLRGLCYLLWVYTWEYSTGYVLSLFQACPWNYSDFNYNVHGLITFEYAPLWYFVSLIMERFVITQLPQLQWKVKSKVIKGHNALTDHKNE